MPKINDELTIIKTQYLATIIPSNSLEETLKIVNLLNKNKLTNTIRSDARHIICLIEDQNSLNKITKLNKKIYIGANPKNNNYGLIYSGLLGLEFSSPQVVAAYRAWKHNLKADKIYFLTKNGKIKVKNGKLSTIKDLKINFKQKLKRNLKKEKLKNIVSKKISKSEKLNRVIIDFNNFTQLCSNLETLKKTYKFLYTISKQIINENILIESLTADSLSIWTSFEGIKNILKIVKKTKKNYKKLPKFKITSIPVTQRIVYLKNKKIIWFEPPISQKEEEIISELEKKFKTKNLPFDSCLYKDHLKNEEQLIQINKIF